MRTLPFSAAIMHANDICLLLSHVSGMVYGEFGAFFVSEQVLVSPSSNLATLVGRTVLLAD